VCVEVDGGLHREAGSWRRDLDRQNQIVLDGLTVLRFPSITVRLHPEIVIDQLARALGRPAGGVSVSGRKYDR
jgi:very-short-patch-repair endonuclease